VLSVIKNAASAFASATRYAASAVIRSSDQRLASGCAPVIRFLLIIQVPDTSDKRGVAFTFRPLDRFSLRFEGAEHVVRMVFDHIIVDMAPLRASLGARLNVNVRHICLSLIVFVGE
jgi:hypothetical protein